MGLMSWLRGGGRTEASAGTGAGTGSAGAAPAAAPRERVDLAELPPIQRMLGGQDLVIDPSGFQGALATRQDTSLGTPLGHLVSPDAPTGLVHGITAPAPAEHPSPVQRSVERPGEPPVRTGYVPLSVPMSVQRAAASGAPSDDVGRGVGRGGSAGTAVGGRAASRTATGSGTGTGGGVLGPVVAPVLVPGTARSAFGAAALPGPAPAGTRSRCAHVRTATHRTAAGRPRRP